VPFAKRVVDPIFTESKVVPHMQFSHLGPIVGTLILAASVAATGCAGGAQTSGATDARVAPQLSATDEQLAANVQAALHADPYFYDKHVTVSIEHGDVVLRGFVSNSSDLVNAKKIAAKAAGGRRVIDDLSIKPIDEPTTGVKH
jgi:osmotically-inducible protein OsmY